MKDKIEIDIIMVSYAQTDDLKKITISAINSLVMSENSEDIKFNIIIIESNRSMFPYQYPNSTTIYPDKPFGYHRYLNIGINMTSASFICICNNDLIFHASWATELLKPLMQYVDLFSVSPFCSKHHRNEGFKFNDGIKLGYRVRQELAGWCILFKRELLNKIGMLDENYIFWCADNDYANTLYTLKLHHALVTTSIVDHLESETLKEQSEERKIDLTENEVHYYKKKWNVRLGEEWKSIG